MALNVFTRAKCLRMLFKAKGSLLSLMAISTSVSFRMLFLMGKVNIFGTTKSLSTKVSSVTVFCTDQEFFTIKAVFMKVNLRRV